jgi:hypothetical protein
MISLKLSKKERKNAVTASPEPGPEYPYWSRVNLDSDTLDKLGLDFSKIRVGQAVSLVAKGEVVATLQATEKEERYNDTCITIQMTDLGVDLPKTKSAVKDWAQKRNGRPGGPA